MDKTSFIFHTEWGRLFRRLSDADCKRLLSPLTRGRGLKKELESKGSPSELHPFSGEDEVNQAHTIPNSNQMQAKIPTLEQVQAYAREQQAVTSPERFYNYFAANGWIERNRNGKQQKGCPFDGHPFCCQEKPALSPEKAAIYFSIHAP